MGSLSELPRRRTQKMKFFALLTLAAVVVADYEKEMMTKWIKMKAMESCWGSENMKLYTVELKKAIAKCSNEDAPELSLPPYRSSYRFVNAMINQGNNMDMLKNMMAAMSTSMNQDNSEFSYVQPYSTNSGKSDSFMDKMKMMMKMKMKDIGQTTRTTTTWPSSSRAWAPPTGWTTTGQEATGRTTPCLSSSRCSTPTGRRDRPLTASTLETDSLRSLPSRSTTWRPRSATCPAFSGRRTS